MKIITVLKPEVYDHFIKDNPDINGEPFNSHPAKIPKLVDDFIQENEDSDKVFYTENTVAMDFIPEEYLFHMNEEGGLVPFSEMYKEELKSLFPGEAFLSRV